MTIQIHPTAIVHPKAHLAEGVEVGPYAVIGDRVYVGDHTKIGAHVVLEGCVKIGQQNHLFPGVTVGLEPQDVSYRGAESWVEIGDRNQIREYVTIHRATQGDATTRIGNDNFLMAYAHVAHNCHIQDETTIANAVSLGGYVQVESRAVIGGMVGVHQWVRIGRCAMVGGMSRINRDVPPYMLVEGSPARVRGLNVVGLKRTGITAGSPEFQALKQAYRLLYRSTVPFEKALAQLSEQAVEGIVSHLVTFIEGSQLPKRRGVISGRGRGRTSRDDD